MAFQVQEYAYELIGALQPLSVRIRRQDRSLADQLTRAASSIALNDVALALRSRLQSGALCYKVSSRKARAGIT